MVTSNSVLTMCFALFQELYDVRSVPAPPMERCASNTSTFSFSQDICRYVTYPFMPGYTPGHCRYATYSVVPEYAHGHIIQVCRIPRHTWVHSKAYTDMPHIPTCQGILLLLYLRDPALILRYSMTSPIIWPTNPLRQYHNLSKFKVKL